MSIPKRLDIMKKLTTLSCGANRETSIKFYNIDIKPKIIYGSSMYETIKNSE